MEIFALALDFDILQTFRRYNYTVIFGNADDQFLEDLKERSDYLDKYLNV